MDSTMLGDVGEQNNPQQILVYLQSSSVKLGDKHELLNTFLRLAKNQPQIANPILDLKEIPDDFFIKKIRLELIISFQRADLIIELLKTEEKTLFSAISKKGRLSWAFQNQSSPFLNATFLIHKIFPKISYVCRLKIVNQLARFVVDEGKCEAIFEVILTAFGIKHAAKLLPNCSPNFIRSILLKHSTKKLPIKVLQLISTKHPQIGFEYVKSICQQNTKLAEYENSSGAPVNELRPMLNILASADLKQFLDFYETYHRLIHFQLCTSLSSSALQHYWDRILSNPEIYSNSNFLDAKAVIKLPRDQLVAFLVPLMPKTFKNMQSVYSSDFTNWNKYLERKHFSTTGKMTIFKEVLERVHSAAIKTVVDKNAENISVDLAAYFGPEERLRIAESRLKSDVNIRDIHRWISLKLTSHSIPELKKLLFIESEASKRATLLLELMNTCKINNDGQALLEVLKLVNERYRNDDIEILSKVLTEFGNAHQLFNLTEEHWDCVNELIKIWFISFNSGKTSYWRINDLLYKVFINLVERGLPLVDIVEKIIQAERGSPDISLLQKELKFEKRFLEEIMDYYCKKYHGPTSPRYDKNDSRERLDLSINIAQLFKNWNSRHWRNKISITSYPNISKYLIGLLKKLQGKKELSESECYRIFNVLKYDPQLKNEASVLNFYKVCLKKFPSEEIFLYFLQKDPQQILANYDTVIQHILGTKGYGSLLRVLKYHNYKEICNKLVERSLVLLEHKSTTRLQIQNAFLILSLYNSSSSYVEFIRKFVPDQSKVDLRAPGFEFDLHLKEFAIRSMAHIDQASVGFQILREFCIGDYLKYARDTLYSICEHSKLENSLDFLSKLVDSPVSLKKHIIRIYCSLIPELPTKLAHLENLWKTEKNPSIREVLINHALEILLEVSSSEAELGAASTFLLDAIIPSLTYRDKTAITYLVMNIGQILSSLSGQLQENFLLGICSKIFEVQEHLPVQERIEEQTKLSLIQFIGQNYFQLSEDCLHKLMEQYFFSAIDFGKDNEFLCLFVRILLLKDAFAASAMLTRLLNKIEQNASNIFGPGHEIRKKDFAQLVTKFFRFICSESFSRSKEKRDMYSEKYKQIFQHLLASQVFSQYAENTFDEFFWIQAGIIFYSWQNLSDVGKEIGNLLSGHVSSYGNEILPLLIKNLVGFLNICNLNDEVTKLELIKGLISLGPNKPFGSSIATSIKIIALQLFPSTCPENFNSAVYDEISNVLLQPAATSTLIEARYINHWKKSLNF